MSALDKVLELLAAQQGQAQQAGNNLAKTAAQPINRGYLNQGQSAMDGLINPTANQNRALLTASLAMMGHDPTKMPGQTLSRGISQGLNLLDGLREDDQGRRIDGAQAELDAATNAFDTTQGMIRTATGIQQADTQSRFADARMAAAQGGSGDRKTRVTDIDGKRVLIDENTGETIRELGVSPAIAKEENKRQYAEEQIKIKQTESARSMLDNAELTLGTLGKAIDQADNFAASGFLGGVSKGVPGTPAYNLNQLLMQVRSTIGFTRLQQMRDESPTGGALGQVSQMELQQLNAALGSLEVGQDDEQMIENLNTVKRVYAKILAESRGFLGEELSDEDLEAKYS